MDPLATPNRDAIVQTSTQTIPMGYANVLLYAIPQAQGDAEPLIENLKHKDELPYERFLEILSRFTLVIALKHLNLEQYCKSSDYGGLNVHEHDSPFVTLVNYVTRLADTLETGDFAKDVPNLVPSDYALALIYGQLSLNSLDAVLATLDRIITHWDRGNQIALESSAKQPLHWLDVLELLEHKYSDKGRLNTGSSMTGDCVLEALLSNKTDETLVTWPDATELTDCIIVKISFPVRGTEPGWDFSESMRRCAEKRKTRSHAKNSETYDDRRDLNHLPDQVQVKDGDADQIQTRFHRFLSGEVGMQALQINVQVALQPITQVQSGQDLLTAWRGLFSCYKWLYLTAGIMRRDIGINNCMLRHLPGSDSRQHSRGVLRDFGLTVHVGKITADKSSNHRTGTEPFQAIDRLRQQGTPHFYRFDLESMFYAMVWHVSRYEDGKEIENPPYQNWPGSSTLDPATIKSSFLVIEIISPTKEFRPLCRRLFALQETFHSALHGLSVFRRDCNHAVASGQPPPQFDIKTVHGRISFEVFSAILNDPEYDDMLWKSRVN